MGENTEMWINTFLKGMLHVRNKKKKKEGAGEREEAIMLYIRCLLSGSMAWNEKKEKKKWPIISITPMSTLSQMVVPVFNWRPLTIIRQILRSMDHIFKTTALFHKHIYLNVLMLAK